MENPASQASVYRVNLIRDQLETLLNLCRTFTQDSHCPVKINIFKRKLQTFTKEITNFFTIHDSEEVINNLTQFQLECEDLLAELELFSSPQCSRGPEQRASKLPTLELTKFDGDILRWQEFHDTFCSNIDSRNLSDVDKMLYLKSVLEGKAKEVIEGIQATNLNYQIALKALRDRYGNKSILIDSHYNALYSLKTCGPDINECRRTYNEIERHLRVLSALGEDTSGNHLRTIILSKFPENFKYELHLRLKEDERTVGNIRSHLELLIRANEMSHRSTPVEQFTTEALISTATTSTPSDANRYIPKKQFLNRKRKTEVHREPPKKKRHDVMPCIFCQELHYNEECSLSLSGRREKIKEKGKCYICLREGHFSKVCKNKRRCIHCKRNDHNRALCDKFKGNKRNNPTTTLVSYNTSLQTAIVSVQGYEKNDFVKCRAILDSGSQRSYITCSKAKQLKLKFTEENCLMIYTFGSNKPKEIISPLVNLNLLTKSGICKTIEANVIPLITERVGDNHSLKSLVKLIQEKFKSKIILADDYSMGTQIDLLIGNDFYFQFVHNEKKQVNEHLFLIKSDFGWLTSGRYRPDKSSTLTMNVVTYSQEAAHALSNNFATPDLPLKESIVNQIWELEALGITDSPKSKRDEEAIENFNHTIQMRDSRYYVTWPWIEFPPDLPTNYSLAFGRLKSLIKRLDQKAIQEYDNILNDQMKNNVVEVVPILEPIHQTPVHYIPHHIVHQTGKKGRIVYDASAKIKGHHSLNECLYKGPLMLEDLTALLINFRIHKVGITADIEKAFLQIGLKENDRDVTRFLWLRDTKGEVTPDNIIHMRFCRVPFGIISSPFLLTATVRYHINKKDPDLLQLIANKCYADNLVTGAKSTKEAYELFVKTRDVFDDLSMNIRDWLSNNTDFMRKIPPELKSKDIEMHQCKVLGMLWNTMEDTLQLKYNSTGTANIAIRTKRDVLRILGSVYDPCGLVSPILMPIKLYLQDLWRQKIKWDTLLSEDLIKLWKIVSEGLKEISEIKIPRYFCLIGSRYELHCFADAAEKAYVAVVYLRDSKTKSVYFVMSKSRIAPLKEKEHLKIPKLELLGVLIGSRLMTYINKSLQLSISRLVLWTDSQIVLSWIKGNKLLSPFVARRIKEIKQNNEMEFRYVPSKDNPADVGTRPYSAPLSQSIWLSGPPFLKKIESEWPAQITTDSILLAGEVLTLVGEQDVCNGEGSSYQEEEVQEMEPVCDEESLRIRYIQKRYFYQEYIGKITNISRSLQLYKDDKGLLRCKGRFQNAEWSQEQKFPILLPREAELTHSTIKHIHETNYHVGVSHTLALLRKRFWVPKGRSTVQKVIKRCTQCRKYAGGPFKLPPMPPLPEERVTCCPAYSYTGTDYMGPLRTSSGDKRWICVLTCLSIRAVHLEVVHNLTAEEFNLAIRRFVAVRGLPLLITSDNATQMKLMADVITGNQCIENQVKWRFIPELAPWFGGFYERLMSLIKNCMKRTLEKLLLNDQQLLTIVKEIEAVLNTRPLTYIADEIEHVLSPIDFLRVGGPVVTKSSEEQILGQCTSTKENLIQGWKRGQKIIQEFSKMFIGQYLPYLRQRGSVHKEPRVVCNREPRVGEMVQIKSDSNNRANWKVGKITQLIKSRDGNIRVAKVRTDNGHILTRSIAHLYPLELDNEFLQDDKTSESPVNNNPSESKAVDNEMSKSPVKETSIVVDNEMSKSPVKETAIVVDNEMSKSPVKETSIVVDNKMSKSPVKETRARPQRKAAIKARSLLKGLTKQLLARQ